MSNKKDDKNIGTFLKNISLAKLQSPNNLVSLKYNNKFCNSFFEKNKMISIVDDPADPLESTNLVYDYSKVYNNNEGIFQTIIDLLLELRASKNDQNVFLQNAPVIREQILTRLKNEIFRINHKLTNSQIKKLEVISSGMFDEKALSDILNSFLDSSKKKSDNLLALKPISTDIKQISSLSLNNKFLNYLKKSVNKSVENQIVSKNVNKLTYKKTVKKLEDENIYDKDLKYVSEKKNKTKKSSKNEIYLKKLTLEKQDELNASYKIYEDILSEKNSLFLPLLKLQVKNLESKIVSKTKRIVKKYLDKKTVQTLSSETELVNKVISKAQINELKENLEKNYERYDYYNLRHQTNIKRVENELKLFKNLQKDVYSKNYTSKSFEFIDLNTRNQLKKNIFKAVTNKNLSYKIENLSESFFNDYIKKTSSRQYGFINKTFENYSKENVERIFRKQVDFKHISNNFFKDSFEYLTRNEVLNEDKNKQIYKHLDFHTNLIKSVKQFEKDKILKKYYDHYDVKKLKNIDNVLEKTEKSIFTNILDKKLKDTNIINSERIYRNIQNISKNLDTKFFVNKIFENFKRVNAISSISKDFKSSKIEHIKLNNLYNIPRIIKSVPKLYTNLDEIKANKVPQIQFYDDKSYMVYKLKESQEKEVKPQAEAKEVENKEIKQPDIIVEKKKEPQRIKKDDLNLIEKQLLKKILSKKDVVDIIKSQLKDINIENISKFVIEKVQRRAVIDRRRNGIF